MSDLLEVLDLFQSAQFTTGLRFGLIALAAGWLMRIATGLDRPPLPFAGLLVALMMVASLIRLEESITPELAPLGLILVGLLVSRIPRMPTWSQPLLVLPGAVWMAVATPVTTLTWVRIAIAILIPVAGFAITDFEKRHSGMGLGVIFWVIAVVGMFLAVPDTEWAVTLLGVALAVSFLSWPRVSFALGREGAYLATAIFLWVAAQGGEARPPSIIGSAACLGLLLLEPLVLRLRPSAVKLTTWFNRSPAGAVVASLPQLFVMVLCARVAARFTTYLPAIAVVMLVFGLVVAAGLLAPERIIKSEQEPVDDLFPGDLY